MAKLDTYEAVTNAIIAKLEAVQGAPQGAQMALAL